MRPQHQIALAACLCFLVYAAGRVKFVFGCDSWAYLAQAQLFLGLDPGLHGFSEPLRDPALTPLGMDAVDGHYVSAFPPGYSLLLALAGLVGGEFWVNPILGAASVVLVYAVLSREATHAVALGLSALWAVCPLVVMNAADVMSDMAATVAVLGTYLLIDLRRLRSAGALLGLSLMIRPNDALFLLPAALLLPRHWRSFTTFGVAFALGALVSASMHLYVWGDLLSPTYRSNTALLGPKSPLAQLGAYTWHSLLHTGPVLLLALYRAVREPRGSLPQSCWFALFLVSHSLADPLPVDWPRARFLLPAMPALFVLSARAVMEFLHAVGRRGADRLGSRALLAGVLVVGAANLARAVHIGALALRSARHTDSETIARDLPENALVGALNFSGSLRLYGDLETFVWLHPHAVSFARKEYARGRPVYLLLENDEILPPWDRPHAKRFHEAFVLEPSIELRDPSYALYRITGLQDPSNGGA